MSYTVVLTKGAHVIPAEDAVKIERAIEQGDKLVRVRFEQSPGSAIVQETTLVLAHVISLFEVPRRPSDIAETAGAKVRALRDFHTG